VNARDIDERLGVDGFGEGALAVVGCGVAAADDPLSAKFEPYQPAPRSRD
jgi:hypothetical protein